MPKNQSKLNVVADLNGMEVLRARLNSHRFPVHFHDTFVIEIIESGSDWCCVHDMVANRGEVFVHFPEATHSGGTAPTGTLSYQAIYPSVELVSELTKVPTEKISTGISFTSSSSQLVNQTRKLFAQLATNSGKTERQGLKAALRSVLLSVLDHQQSLERANSGHNKIRHNDSIEQKLAIARQYLIEQSNRDVSNVELGRRCRLSQFHLIRCFKRRFGITPRQFLISQRVSQAKHLMTTGMPLVEAALETGFSDQSHLARCFKKVTSCSPGQFRNASIDSLQIPSAAPF